MKKIISMWIVALVLANMSITFAEVGWDTTRSLSSPNTYSTAEAFLEAEWKLCTTATDWINVIMIESGEFTISTMAFTPNPEYSCTNYKLSDNDMSFYTTVKNRLDSSYVEKVDAAIPEYEKRMKMLRWSDEKRWEAHRELIERTEVMISDLLMQYPQDIALPAEANEKYLKLTLIKFELILLDM